MANNFKHFMGTAILGFAIGRSIQELRIRKKCKLLKKQEAEKSKLLSELDLLSSEVDKLEKTYNELIRIQENSYGIDPTMLWNDYVKKYGAHSLFLWNGCALYVANQDDFNITEYDEEAGFKDSWVVDIYSIADVPQGGQWMETAYISELNYTLEDIMNKLYNFDLWESDWKILEPLQGGKLQGYYEKINAAMRELKDSRRNLENYLFENDLIW